MFVNFLKAFDVIDHNILLTKFEQYDFPRTSRFDISLSFKIANSLSKLEITVHRYTLLTLVHLRAPLLDPTLSNSLSMILSVRLTTLNMFMTQRSQIRHQTYTTPHYKMQQINSLLGLKLMAWNSMRRKQKRWSYVLPQGRKSILAKYLTSK